MTCAYLKSAYQKPKSLRHCKVTDPRTARSQITDRRGKTMSNKYAIKYAAPNRNATVVLAVILLTLMTGLFGQVAAQQRTSSRNSVNRLAQQGGKEPAIVMFQGGRDLSTDQQWAKAEETRQQS